MSIAVVTKPTDTESSLGKAVNPEPDPQASWIKLLLLALILSGLLTIVYFSPLRQYLSRLQELSQKIRSFGALAPLVLMGGVALLVAIGCPRLVFCILAGMTLGFWYGLLWAQLGTLLGNYTLFLVARAFGHDWAERLLARRGKLQLLVRHRGALGVVIARQVPLPGALINLAFALLPIRHRDFLIGTLIGQLPQAVPCTLIGAGLLQASFKKSLGVIGLGVVVSLLAWCAVRYGLRRTTDKVGESNPTRRMANP